MIVNVFVKRKSEKRKIDIDVSNNSGRITTISGFSRKHSPIRIIRDSYKFLSLLVV